MKKALHIVLVPVHPSIPSLLSLYFLLTCDSNFFNIFTLKKINIFYIHCYCCSRDCM